MGITGAISWPGVNYPQHLIASRTNGARPDTALLFALPQNTSPSAVGSLVFGFDATTITWANALCDKFTMQFTTHGFRQVFVIKDRRWRWPKHYITGAYNVRLPDGTIDPATQKTLAQLATLLFTKAGETADISAITSTEYPMVVWDRANVADELEDLLEQRGYVISLQANDSVKVYARGVGATLPANGDVVNVSISVDPPQLPDKLIAALAKTRVQSKLKLVPAGLDTDGSIKKTQDLSYSPGVGTTGFDGLDLITFAYLTDPKAQDCAQRSVGLWYIVDSQADGTQNIGSYAPGEIAVSSMRQLLPLSDELVATGANVFGVAQKNPAFVEGTFEVVDQQPPSNGATNKNSPDFTLISHRDWKLDGRIGVVKFRDPAFKWDATGSKRVFADVYLTCSYSVSDPATWIKDRELREKVLGGYGEDNIELTELERTLLCVYSRGSPASIASITDTKATVDAAADLYLNAAATQYATSVGTILLYRGIYGFNPDGLSLQIVWQCAAPGNPVPFSTHASMNAEVHPLLPTRAQRGLARRARRSQSPNTSRNNQYRRGQDSTVP